MKSKKRSYKLQEKLDDVKIEIDKIDDKLFDMKMGLAYKYVAGPIVGTVCVFCTPKFCNIKGDNITELVNGFIQKAQENPAVVVPPAVTLIAIIATIKLIVKFLGYDASFSEIKEAFEHKNNLMNKKKELEELLNGKKYVDADREKIISKIKTRKNKRLN